MHQNRVCVGAGSQGEREKEKGIPVVGRDVEKFNPFFTKCF